MAESTKPGPGVDFQGRQVIDPTENVIALQKASAQRQDDLRIASEKLMEAELHHIRLTETLRAEHAREINQKESNRLDAIRQVDVLNGNTAAAAAADAIRVLAATTAANAEKLRTDLNATAATMAKQTADVAATMAAQQAATVAGITERLAALEKSSYEGIGKGRVADPMMAELIAEMRSVVKAQTMGGGEAKGKSDSWALIVGAIALISTIMGIGSMIYAASHNTNPVIAGPVPVPAPTPQIIYLQPPPAQPQNPPK
jgi:hypothetical protein